MARGYDEFFFIQVDQLFRILILHSAGQEDWELYNAFLESLTFDLGKRRRSEFLDRIDRRPAQCRVPRLREQPFFLG